MPQNVKLQRFYNDTRNLYTRVSMDANEWRKNNDGAVPALTTSTGSPPRDCHSAKP